MSGKGSKPRPYSVPKEKFDDNWEAIFGKKKEKQNEKQSQGDNSKSTS